MEGGPSCLYIVLCLRESDGNFGDHFNFHKENSFCHYYGSEDKVTDMFSVFCVSKEQTFQSPHVYHAISQQRRCLRWLCQMT